MKILVRPDAIRKISRQLKGKGKTLGLVPTMGALHEGHLSLVRASLRENDATAVSIFVNPLQFGPREDLKKYPRTLHADLKKLRALKVDYVFCPTVKGMYPSGVKAGADIRRLLRHAEKSAALARNLCGRFRPGHFDGVRAVVLKLFQTVEPRRAYFGAKDYQQARIIEQMAQDLKLPVKVRVMPLVRERGGLAMSSRNRYLNGHERRQARAISRVLFGLRRRLRSRPSGKRQWLAQARKDLGQAVDRLQYLELVDAQTLGRPGPGCRKLVAACACFVGKTRLIDNVIIALRRSKTGRR